MAAALLVAAVGGGVVAVAVAALAGVGEHTTTVREVGGNENRITLRFW